jgi:membrane associated rhomboid family serine protease
MFTRTESFREFLRFYPVVSFIITIHIILYLLSIMLFFPNQWFYETFSGVNLYIMQGQIWRLLTPTFMHSGFLHMLFNSFSLVLFGPPLERMLGKGRFLLVYFVSGIVANIATLILEPLTFIHVGSSGAIFGLFGYYISIIMFQKRWMSTENTQIILTLCAVSLIMTFIQPNINITAHLFGLISGFLLGCIPYFNKNDWNNSMQDVGNWAGRHTRRFSSAPPLRIIIWGVIILFSLIGLWAQK